MWKIPTLVLATAALVVFHTPLAALAFFGVVVGLSVTTVFASTPSSGGREL
jgi:uncharacterized membrane-anchored protein YitT (DUF2179 family)